MKPEATYLIMFPIMLLLVSAPYTYSSHCHSFVWTFYELLHQTLGGKNDWNVSYLIMYPVLHVTENRHFIELVSTNWVLMFTLKEVRSNWPRKIGL